MTRNQYQAIGNKIINMDTLTGESYDVALCDTPTDAIKLFDKAHYLNDVKHKYTDSARMFAKAESLPGFKWLSV